MIDKWSTSGYCDFLDSNLGDTKLKNMVAKSNPKPKFQAMAQRV